MYTEYKHQDSKSALRMDVGSLQYQHVYRAHEHEDSKVALMMDVDVGFL